MRNLSPTEIGKCGRKLVFLNYKGDEDMFFYNVRIKVKKDQWFNNKGDRHDRYEIANDLCYKSEEFAQSYDYNMYFWINKINASSIDMGAIVKYQVDMNKYVEEFLKKAGIEYEEQIVIKESVFDKTTDAMRDASRKDYINDTDDILEKFGINLISGQFMRDIDFKEYIVNVKSKEKLCQECREILSENTTIPELERIYKGKATDIQKGHPVHYMIMADAIDAQKGISEILMSALYDNNRIVNKRYSLLDIRADMRFRKGEYNECYKINFGGTVVVRFRAADDEEDDRASSNRSLIESICGIAKKYRNEALTIFIVPRECTNIKKIFYEYLSNMSIVEITENNVTGEKAKECLKNIAIKNGVDANDDLLESIDETKSYYGSELKEIYDKWYDKELKTRFYPQYKNITTINSALLSDEPKGCAYDELTNMIGLEDAKKVINQAIKYFKAQKIFAEKGMKVERPSMHMVFTGNPGTAKTTAARLFAQIMKDNQLLSRGHIIEVGRSDLVGKYVGWTAPTIKRKFIEAKGGVLFIDEAYSLVDDRSGSYGDEAINTIVQEMENHREDVVVIFAGYPEEMEQFLQKNPGLRSRIAFHVPFADYDTDELCDIAQLIAKNKGVVLSAGASERLREEFEVARHREDFGNGRYVRNVLEKAKMAQATRLIDTDYNQLSDEDIVTICEEDIELNTDAESKNVRQIGFVMHSSKL